MTNVIQRPSGVNVGVNNPGKRIYIGNINADTPANDTTDGSIRIEFTLDDPTAHITLRTSGVWNDTGFRFASSSISLGRDLQIGAVGGYIESRNISEIDEHVRSLLPHIQFDNSGTSPVAHMPILDVREDFVIFSGPATGEIVSTTIGQVFSAFPTRILHSVTHTTGSVGATAPIQISYFKGTDNTGFLLSRFNIPASVMPAATTFTIVYDDDFGFENAQNIFFEYDSPNDISLTTNSAGDVITTQNGHVLKELGILLENLMLDENLDLMFDQSLNPMYAIQFP